MGKILIVHGANVNMLGLKEPEIYGTTSYPDLNRQLQEFASEMGTSIDIVQSNYEGDIVKAIQEAPSSGVTAIVLNPGDFGSSIPIRGAVSAVRGLVPTIEVHLTNTIAHGVHSVISSAAIGVIAGFGVRSYLLGIQAALDIAKDKGES